MSTHIQTHDPEIPTTEQQEPIFAAQYVRMSTEHQQYSTSNQEDVIRSYAENRGLEIVRTYADEGKSGLSVSGRNSLKRLIADVTCGKSNFSAILVYDVSRWGRFQDADESAYYEYLCKQAGIDVHYCAEQFENDGGPTSTIIKSVKRAMAGEYSRELSSKVFQGQCRLIELGYRQGGAPGFGLRRMLIDQLGQEKGLLDHGQQKSLQTDRVILVPGPEEEVATVRWMYDQFVNGGRSEAEIADLLNQRGFKTDLGRDWNRGTVRQILTNEKYIGNNVYNRTSFKLKRKHVHNAPDMWVRKDRAFRSIVSDELFFTARGIVQERNRRYSNEELIAMLRRLAERCETISAAAIDAADHTPPAATFRSRFGSLLAAYRQAGCMPDRNYEYVEINRQLREKLPTMVSDVQQRLQAVGASVSEDADSGYLMIYGEYSASIVLSRCRKNPGGSLRWQARFDAALAPDITILARMDSSNSVPADYYLLPIMDIQAPRLLLCEENGAYLDTYQFESLDYFASLAARRPIEVAA
ncbi:MAG: recombinase family protein [Pirellulales bacterium]|nr:recombinase family protein [Pirellulales bacterium]